MSFTKLQVLNEFTDAYVDLEIEDVGQDTDMYFAQAQEAFYGRINEGLTELKEGPGYTTEKVKTAYPITNPYGVSMPVTTSATYETNVRTKDIVSHIDEYAPMALGINNSQWKKIDPKQSDLTALSFLKDPQSQLSYLAKEYGVNNVRQLDVEGSLKNFYSPDEGKTWGLVDNYDYDLMEFAADASSEIIPMTLGVASVMKAGFGTGGFGLLASPAIFNTAYALTGTGQDAAARATLGVDLELGEIATRRAKEFALNMTVDSLFLGTTRGASKLFMGQKADDIVAREATAIFGDMKKIPNFVQRGGQNKGSLNLLRGAEIAGAYPNSTGAKFFNQARELGVTGFKNEFGGYTLTPMQKDNILRESLDTITRQQSDDVTRIENNLVDLATNKEAVKGTGISEAKIRNLATGEAKDIFDKNLKSRANKLTTAKSFTPEVTGQNMIQNYAKRYLNLESNLYNQYTKVYDKMSNINLNISDITKVLKNVNKNAATDAEGMLILELSSSSQKFANRVINNLDEISAEQINFKDFNEFIKELATTAKKKSNAGASDAFQYSNMVEQLKTQRDKLLKQADPRVQADFRKADDFFKSTILEARSGDIYKYIELSPGQTWKDAIRKNANGEPYRMPKFKDGGDGTGFLNYALQKPANLRQALNVMGNDPASRQILREAYLRKLGLATDKPLDANTLRNISDKDMDMGNILFPGQGKNSLSAKMKDIAGLQQFAADKDNFISGIEPDIFNRILATEDGNVQKTLLEIAEKQVKEQAQLDELNKDFLMKLFRDGKIPLPENQFTIDGLMSSFMRAKPADLKGVIEKLAQTNPKSMDAVELSVMQWLMDRAGNGAVTSQQAFGDYIWNPTKMEAIIRNNKDNLITILGKEKYDAVLTQNAGIKQFSVGDLDPAGNVSIAGNPFQGTATPFWSGLGSVFTDKMGAIMLAYDIKNPFKYKKMLTKGEYLGKMKQWSVASMMGSKTYTSFQNLADTDPRYRTELTEYIGTVMAENRAAVEQVEQGMAELDIMLEKQNSSIQAPESEE